MDKVAADLSIELYQWIMFMYGIVSKALDKVRAQRMIMGLFINDYNASCEIETERVKEIDYDIQIAASINTADINIFADDKLNLRIKSQGGKFSIQNDMMICAYTTEVQSLLVTSVRPKELDVVSVSQMAIIDSVNKIARRRSFVVQSVEANAILHVLTCIELCKDFADYLAYHKHQEEISEKVLRPFDELCAEKKKENLIVEHTSIEPSINKVRLKVMPKDELICTFKLDNITNTSLNVLSVPLLVQL